MQSSLNTAKPSRLQYRSSRRTSALSRVFAVALAAGFVAIGAPALANNPNVRVKAPAPTPDAAATGCHLSATVYDSQKDRTTFSYDCDHAVDAAGHRSYTVTKRGNYFRGRI
jgi:hypothetical protein